MRFKNFIKMLLVIAISFSLLNCMPYDFSRRYVQQGNLLPAAKMTRLKVGMSKEDCAILMGTSLLSPMFNNDRWDYAYTFRDGGKEPVVRKVSLYFVRGALVRWECKGLNANG